MTTNKAFQSTFAYCQERVNDVLNVHLTVRDSVAPPALLDAMRYSALNGGKRLRAAIVYLTGITFNIPWEHLDAPACAVELIHAYSLIHDDLPAMDNSPLRRGKPSCHIAFDEATAILAGDALHTLAFEVLSQGSNGLLLHSMRIEMISRLSQACGAQGMAGGQVIDLSLEQQRETTLTELETMHRLKTGVLIEASALMGMAALTPSSPSETSLIKDFSTALGIAFQIQDDILDVEGTMENLGKPQGHDQTHLKSTYPSILGIEEAKKQALKWRDKAIACLDQIPRDTHLLEALAYYVIERKS